MEGPVSLQLGHLLEDVLALPGNTILELLVVVKDVSVEHLREGGGTSPTSRLEHTLEYVDYAIWQGLLPGSA